MQNTDDFTLVAFRLPRELLQTVDDLAKKMDVYANRSLIIRTSLKQFIAQHEELERERQLTS